MRTPLLLQSVPFLLLLCSGGAIAQTESASKQAAKPAPSSSGTLMTLEHAYDIAAASDQTLRIAYLGVRQAELQPLSALTRITPRLNGSAGYDRASKSYKDPDRTGQHSGVARSSLTLELPLLDFSVFPARRKGKLAVESSRLGRKFTIREILFGVTKAYFDVLKGERVVGVNQQSLVLAQEQETLAQKRADVGEVTRSDVLRAQVSVETARRALITSQNDLEFQRNTLLNILNLPPEANLRLAEPLPYKRDVPEFGPLLARAYDYREDLKESGLAIQQAEMHRQEVRAQMAPRVVAQGGPSIDRSSGSQEAAGRHSAWTGGVAVEFPLFKGGQRELDIVGAGYDIQQATLEKEKLTKSIESEVKQAWLTVQTLEGSLRAVRAQVQAAEQGYKDLQNQYSAGTAKSVDVLSALKDLSSARADLATLSLDYQVGLRALERVSGTFQDQRVRQLTER